MVLLVSTHRDPMILRPSSLANALASSSRIGSPTSSLFMAFSSVRRPALTDSGVNLVWPSSEMPSSGSMR